MDTSASVRLQRGGAWCGLWYTVTALLGWVVIAGFVPPPKPTDTPQQIAELFRDDTLRIRIGMLFIMVAALFMIGFGAAIAKLLARIEGRAGVLAYASLLGSAGNMVLTFYPATLWLVAAYRPDRDPDLIYLINDIGWLQFLGGVTMYLALPLSMAVAAFVDNSPQPLLPRWSGYLNIWVVILIIPDQLLFFFQRGPFAWTGLFGLYLPVGTFFLWFGLVIYLLLRSAARVAADAPQAPTPSPALST